MIINDLYNNKKQDVAEGLDPEKKQRLKDLIDQYRDATDPEAYYGLDDEYPDAEEVIAQIRQEFGDRTADSVEQGPSMHYPRPGHSRGHDPMQYKSSPRITKSGVLNKQDVGSMKRDIKQRLKQDMAEGKKQDSYHIVNKDGKPATLASYADRASAEKDRDAKHPGAQVRQVGPRGKVKGVAEGGIATVGWPDEDNHTGSNPPVSVGGTFDARPVVKRGSLVKASGLSGVYRVMDILRDEAKIFQEIPRTGVSTYVPMSDLRVWTNKPIVREQGMAEGQLELNTPDPVVVVQDQQGKILDKVNLSVAAQKYKLGQPQNIKNQLAHQNYTKIGNYTIVSPMTGQPQDQTTTGQKTTFATPGMAEDNAGVPVHRIGLTVTDPNHPMVSKRGETIQKTVRVPGADREKAINSAIAHYRRKGYKVHDHHYIGTVEQGMMEGPVTKKPQPYNDPDWIKKLPKDQLDALGGKRYNKDKKDKPVKESIADDMAAMAKKKFPNAYISKNGQEVQKPENWGKPYTPPAAAPVDLEKQQRELTAKYPNIDELVRRAELNRDPDYEMADGQAYYAARDAEQNYQKLRQIQRVIQGLNESLNRSHLP